MAIRESAVDLLAPLTLAVALGLPFGPQHVLRETVVFNLRIGHRDELTTFYPNVLSGVLEWADTSWLYPVLAVIALAASTLTALRVGVIMSMFVVTTVFLLVSPTPEPQYTPVVLILLVALIAQREQLVAASPSPRREPGVGIEPTAS